MNVKLQPTCINRFTSTHSIWRGTTTTAGRESERFDSWEMRADFQERGFSSGIWRVGISPRSVTGDAWEKNFQWVLTSGAPRDATPRFHSFNSVGSDDMTSSKRSARWNLYGYWNLPSRSQIHGCCWFRNRLTGCWVSYSPWGRRCVCVCVFPLRHFPVYKAGPLPDLYKFHLSRYYFTFSNPNEATVSLKTFKTCTGWCSL